MDEEVKEEIIKLLQQKEPDIEKATQLMLNHGTNKNEVQLYTASPGRYLMQMRWALAKLIGISLVDFQRGYFTDLRKKGKEDWPAVITRIKEELPIILQHRTKIQKALVELGEANDEETKAKAIELGEAAEALGVRHQLLDESKEMYFKSEGEFVPNEEELFPEEDAEETDVPEEKYDWDGDQVKAMEAKKNLGINLTKDRNRLKYQSPSAKDKAENPMPEGPERDKIESRISDREKELAAIAEFLTPKDDTDKTE